jgi:hypothetical protein
MTMTNDEAEIKRLRQGLWDCARMAGADGDGNETPDHLAYPDIVEFAKRAVEEMRRDYDDLLDSPLTASSTTP